MPHHVHIHKTPCPNIAPRSRYTSAGAYGRRLGSPSSHSLRSIEERINISPRVLYTCYRINEKHLVRGLREVEIVEDGEPDVASLGPLVGEDEGWPRVRDVLPRLEPVVRHRGVRYHHLVTGQSEGSIVVTWPQLTNEVWVLVPNLENSLSDHFW